MRALYCLLLLLIPFTGIAQNFSGQWKGHYSYFQIKDMSAGDNQLYIASENALFTYDVDSNLINTFSTVEGLSGELISAIFRSEAFEVTLIGYENGLIEIIQDNEDDIVTLIDIRDKPTIAPDRRKINHFAEKAGRVLVSTGFGIVELNLDKLEFGDTYFIGAGGSQIEVAQTAFFEDNIYAATRSNGLIRASETNPNLVDFNQWTLVSGGNFNGVQLFGDQLYLQQNSNLIRRLQGNSLNTVLTLPTTINSMRSSGEELVVTSGNNVRLYDTSLQLIRSIANPGFDSFLPTVAISMEEDVFIGASDIGAIQMTIADGTEYTNITPSGPLANDPFAVQFIDDNLWVTYGEHNVFFNPFPLKEQGISRLPIGEDWLNISKDDILGATSLVHIAVNPNNTEQVFISSFQDGLLELNENNATALYNSSNSGFETFVAGDEVVRLNGAAFNSDGNLWIVNSRLRDGLKLFNPETKEVTGINISGAIASPLDEAGFSKLVLDRRGNVFFGSTLSGVVGYNPENGAVRKIDAGNDSSFALEDVRALAVDQNNQLWIGTRGGLRVFFNTQSAFEQSNPTSSNIVILDNGVPQELLFEQFISDIEVDGSNNKWIATGSSGVFYLSPDGQETLAHYTTENSPLPSNTVQDITIDGQTGKVYFATTKGLIEFNGSATDPNTSLEAVSAYPNPVRPEFSGMVTIRGLTSRANVKITDIEGNLVYEEVSSGGSIQWDTRAFGKHKVASGVYLILITAEDQAETKVSKLMIVR